MIYSEQTKKKKDNIISPEQFSRRMVDLFRMDENLTEYEKVQNSSVDEGFKESVLLGRSSLWRPHGGKAAGASLPDSYVGITQCQAQQPATHPAQESAPKACESLPPWVLSCRTWVNQCACIYWLCVAVSLYLLELATLCQTGWSHSLH